MDPKNFDLAMRILRRQTPFRPYLIEFASGERIEVHHPEALIRHQSIYLHRSQHGTYTLFDTQQVTRFLTVQKPT
ncbi:MAG: hypothetical protein L0Z62_47655 [Gemmataceae bacterium]|nr:hypothetical protein [Gemmataceae bacterium]